MKAGVCAQERQVLTDRDGEGRSAGRTAKDWKGEVASCTNVSACACNAHTSLIIDISAHVYK